MTTPDHDLDATESTPDAHAFSGRTSSKAPAARGAALVAAAVLALGVAAVALGGSAPRATPTDTTSQAGASAAPTASERVRPDKGPKGGHGDFGKRFGGLAPGLPGRGGLGAFAGGGVSVTAISGSKVSLATPDGWTRTIDVTADTTITRGGAKAALGDLKVGDTIRFRQQKNDDGTFRVTAIEIVLPRIVGTVTAASGSTLTVLLGDGSTVTVHAGSATKLRVRGVDQPTVADVKTGMVALVVGEKRADGSIDATGILAGQLRAKDVGPKVHGPKPGRSAAPEASGQAG
jgi:hypothetical protein